MSDPDEVQARPEGWTSLPTGDPLAGFPGLLDCIHCGLCLQACPTYRASGIEGDSPRGRIALMRAQSEGRVTAPEAAAWVDRCVMCRACEPVCPSQVQYHQLVERQRASLRPARGRGWLERYAASVALQRWSGRFARGARRLGLLALVRRWGPRRLRTLAAAVPERPTAWRPAPGAVFAARGEPRGRVALHLGCANPEWFGAALRDVVAVLAHEGFEVHVPAQPPCCGALATHAGDAAGGAAGASATLRALAGADAIIVPAAGCAAHLAETDPRAAVAEPLAFLARRGLRGPLHEVRRSAVHAPPCHQQFVLKDSAAVEDLLARIPGLDLRPLADAGLCCGAGGAAFSEQPEIAAELGARKSAAVAASGAAWVLTGNPGCLLQIESALRAAGQAVQVGHPASLLREALHAAAPVKSAARR